MRHERVNVAVAVAVRIEVENVEVAFIPPSKLIQRGGRATELQASAWNSAAPNLLFVPL